jgi:hypothetical protein
MPNKPKSVAHTTCHESSNDYFDVTAQLNDGWRVIVTRDGLSWAIQKRLPGAALAKGERRRGSPVIATGRRPKWFVPPTDEWRSVSFTHSRDSLIRGALTHAGDIDAMAMATMVALPATIDARSDEPIAAPVKPRRSLKPSTETMVRTCRCGVTFTAAAMNQRFHTVECRKAATLEARRKSRTRPAGEPVVTPPPVGNNEPHPAFRQGASLAQHIKDVRERLGA